MAQTDDPPEPVTRRRFQRQTAEDRREGLLEATLDSIVRHGAKKTSIRTIAKEAGVSVGLINHHFGSKDALIAAAYSQLSAELLGQLTDHVNQTGGSARDRLSAFIRASFSPLVIDPFVFQTWLAFWTLQDQSEEVSRAHRVRYAAYRGVLEGLIAEAQTESGAPCHLGADMAALGLSGLLDGLWVESCLDPTTFEPEEGIMLAETWLDALLSGKPDGQATDPAKSC